MINETNQHVFRASYSVLNTWATGDWQRATEMYFKLDTFENEAMKQGKELHEQWANEIKATGKMPAVFGAKELTKPEVEIKKEKKLNDWLELVGVIDCLDVLDDGYVLFDWKTGKTTVTADTCQFKVYQILFPEAKRAEIHHYDQYKKQVNVSIAHLTDQTLKEGIEWVLTLASEMHHYFTQNDLYDRLKKQ